VLPGREPGSRSVSGRRRVARWRYDMSSGFLPAWTTLDESSPRVARLTDKIWLLQGHQHRQRVGGLSQSREVIDELVHAHSERRGSG